MIIVMSILLVLMYLAMGFMSVGFLFLYLESDILEKYIHISDLVASVVFFPYGIYLNLKNYQFVKSGAFQIKSPHEK